MLDVLKNSIVWHIIAWSINWLNTIYQHSVLKRIIKAIGSMFRNSYIGRLSGGYLRREPIYFTSEFYRVLKKFIEKCKKMLCFITKPLLFFQSAKSRRTKILGTAALVLLAIGLGTVDEKLFFIAILFFGCSYYILLDYEKATYLLALYAVIDFLFRSYVPAFASVWDELFLICLCILYMFKWIKYSREDAVKFSPFNGCIMFFIGVMLFLMIISPNEKIAVEGFRVNVQHMLWYFVVFQLLKNTDAVKKISGVFVGLVGMLAIYGIYQYVIGVEMPASWISSSEVGIRTRVYAIFTSPNIFGSLLVLAFPICIAFIIIHKGIAGKIIFSVLLVCMAASLVFTYSRGAWIGVVCAVGIYLLLKDKRLIVPAVIGGMIILVLVPSISSRIIYMLSPEYMASSMKAGRLIRWITGFQILQEHPWFGLGLGSFGGAVAANHDLTAMVQGMSVHTFYMDNYYMKIAAEAGLIGLTAFVWLMWQVFSISLKTVSIIQDKKLKELGTGILAGLVGVIVHNCVENVFEVPMMSAMFWMFVAVMAQLWYSNYEKKLD